MSAAAVAKGICALFCLAVVALLVSGICTYWRDIHNVPAKKGASSNGYMSNMLSGDKIKRELPNGYIPNGYMPNGYMMNYVDTVVMQIGIIKNCKFTVNSDAVCEIDKRKGFVGDIAIVSLLSIATVIYVINFLLALGSIVSPKVAYILPLTCFVATLCIVAGAIIFGIYYNEAYLSFDKKITTLEKIQYEQMGVKVHDYYISGESPYKITFGVGFYVTIAAAGLSVLTLFISMGASLIKSKDEKPAGNVQNGSYPPQPQLYQYQQPAQGYPPSPVQPYQYQQPAQGYPAQTPQQAPQYPYPPPKQQQQQPGYATQTPPPYTPPQQNQQVFTPPYSPQHPPSSAPVPSSAPTSV